MIGMPNRGSDERLSPLVALFAAVLIFFAGPILHALTSWIFLEYWDYHYGKQDIIVAVIASYAAAYVLPYLAVISYLSWAIKLHKIARAKDRTPPYR